MSPVMAVDAVAVHVAWRCVRLLIAARGRGGPCPGAWQAGDSSRIQPVLCHSPKGVMLCPVTGPYRHSPDAGDSSRVVALLSGLAMGVVL